MRHIGAIELTADALMDIIRQSPEMVALGVDKDAMLRSASYDVETNTVRLLIEGPLMPDCPQGCLARTVHSRAGAA